MTKTHPPRGSHVQVTVIGAGPYGLSIAAHLTHAGVSHRVFGDPMGAWANHMPAGMHLKSTPDASNLSLPAAGATLVDYARAVGDPAPSEERPIPIAQFVAYGRWFQKRHVPHLEPEAVAFVRRDLDGYEIKLDSGEVFHSDAVVVAAGFTSLAALPDALAPLRLPPEDLSDGADPAHLPPVSHSADHPRLDVFAGRDVALVGGGQAALESAALLHEGGARVQLLVRSGEVRWGGVPDQEEASRWHRLLKPEGGLGTGWSNVAVGRWPGLVRRLPAAARLQVLDKVLGPSGAWWLRPRVGPQIAIHTATVIAGARLHGGRVHLDLTGSEPGRGPDGPSSIDVDHVIACTGYRPSLASYRFLDTELVDGVRTAAGWPVLDAGFTSSISGLHFAGLPSAGSFGPVMRFVYGSDFAARRITAAIAQRR